MAELSTSGRSRRRPWRTRRPATRWHSPGSSALTTTTWLAFARSSATIQARPDATQRGRSSGGSSGHCAVREAPPVARQRCGEQARQLVRRLHRDRVVPIDLADVRSEAMDPGTQSTDDALTTAIRRLPTEDRMLIALRYVAGFDATEIGRTMGLSASGVRSRLARLVARLREEIDHE